MATGLPRYILPFFIAVIFLLLHNINAETVHAQPSITGDYQLLIGTAFAHPSELLPGVQRLSLNLDNRFDDGRFFARADIRNRFEASADSMEWALPELWLELFFPNSDLRIGRQNLQLGLAVANAPVDRIQPLDLRNFLLEPFSNLQRGTIALSYSFYTGNSRFRMILAPVHTPSLIPETDSKWFPHLPVPAGLSVYIEPASNKQPSSLNPQAALIWDTSVLRSVDFQAGILYWKPSMPAYKKSFQLTTPGSLLPDPFVMLQETFTPTTIATGGVSWQTTSSLNILLEAAWFEKIAYDKIPEELLSIDTASPDLFRLPRFVSIIMDETEDFISHHSATDILLEMRYSRSNAQIGIQWYNQLIKNPHPDVIQDTWFQSITTFTSWSFFRDRLVSDLTFSYQVNGKDFWIRTEHSYDIADDVTFSAGAHFFGGPVPKVNYGHPSFGSYRSNSLAFAGVRYYF